MVLTPTSDDSYKYRKMKNVLDDDVEVSFGPNSVDVFHDVRMVQALHKFNLALRTDITGKGEEKRRK